jgi:peptidoglycan/LPS O-acetylase OafA/YrhL
MTVQQSHLSHPKYRPDIDGLRAIAVLAVVAFHAFPTWVRGGFIGVDVFFVISGYLISTIIFENLEKGTFSFSEFYARRIRRIFPALLTVLLACFIFGWFALLADEFKQLGRHMAAGAAFVSNFVLWGEVGYFDNAADTKPLLHLWSLGIEEQFYIIWPPLLWFAWKRQFNLLTITILIAIASFVLNMDGIKQDPIATFYSPLTRFWELLCGSLLAWLTLYKQDACANIKHKIDSVLVAVVYRDHRSGDGKLFSNVLSFIGFFLLIYGFWRINRELSFPGKWALIPVMGAVLIITAGSQAWVNRIFLSNKLAVWFGLISFPLYLWHWPLLSFARIIESETPSPNVQIVAVVLSVLLAWLTYRLIERPIRFGHHGKAKVVTLVILMTIVGYVGYNTDVRDGLAFRNVVKINQWISTGNDDGGIGIQLSNECGLLDEEVKKKIARCFSDTRAPIKYALVGDSKAWSLFSGLVRTSTKEGRWLIIGGAGSHGPLVPVISNLDAYRQHQPLSSAAIKSIASNKQIEKVVIVAATRALFQLRNDSDLEDLPTSNNYGLALDGLKNTVEAFKASGKKIVLLVDNPTLPHPADCLYRRTDIPLLNSILGLGSLNPKCILPLEKHLGLAAKYRELLIDIKRNYPNDVEIFDITKHLCDEEKRECTHVKDGRYLYSYGDHISDYAAGLIGDDLNKFLNRK